MSSRLQFPRSELRARTVRGAVVTAAFLVGIDGLVLGQGLIVTRLLGPSEIGLYGIVSTTVDHRAGAQARGDRRGLCRRRDEATRARVPVRLHAGAGAGRDRGARAGRARAGARRRVRRAAAAGPDARRGLAAARPRAAGAAVDLLPAHGLRAPALAAVRAAAGHLRGHGAAGGGDRARACGRSSSARPPATSWRARWRSRCRPTRWPCASIAPSRGATSPSARGSSSRWWRRWSSCRGR